MGATNAVLELTAEQIYRLALQLPPRQKQELVNKLAASRDAAASPPRVPGCDKGRVRVAPDFNAPLPAEVEDSFYR